MEESSAPVVPAGDTLIDSTLTSAQATTPPSGDAPLTPSADTATQAATSDDSPPPIDHLHIAGLAKGLTKEQKAALLPELLHDPDINAPFQSNVDKAAERRAEERIQQATTDMEMRRQYEGQMVNAEQHLNSLNPQQYREVDFNDQLALQTSGGRLNAKAYRDLKNAVADYKTEQTEAPTIKRIDDERGAKAFETLKNQFAADPDLKGAVDDWDKFSEKIEGATSAEKIASLVHQAIKAGIAHQLPAIKRELAAEAKAQTADGIAAGHEGLPDPVLVGAGVGGNGKSFASVDAARAAHARGEIDNLTMRRALARFNTN